jgi:hydroxymethylglutaryl-CoA lyase
LQNETVFVSTKTKLNLLEQIVEAGFRTLEVTSFVRGDRVPALRDADELTQRLPFYEGVEYRALVPNNRGVERFLSSPVETAIFFISASSAHNEANIQRTMEESLKEMADLIRLVTEEGRHVVGAVATAFVCPYTGVVPDEPLQRIVEVFAKSGVKELSLADTIGKATPDMVYERCAKIKNQFPFLDLSCICMIPMVMVWIICSPVFKQEFIHLTSRRRDWAGVPMHRVRWGTFRPSVSWIIWRCRDLRRD